MFRDFRNVVGFDEKTRYFVKTKFCSEDLLFITAQAKEKFAKSVRRLTIVRYMSKSYAPLTLFTSQANDPGKRNSLAFGFVERALEPHQMAKFTS